jgi:hypothetical protein
MVTTSHDFPVQGYAVPDTCPAYSQGGSEEPFQTSVLFITDFEASAEIPQIVFKKSTVYTAAVFQFPVIAFHDESIRARPQQGKQALA